MTAPAKPSAYQKHHSFGAFYSNRGTDLAAQQQRALRLSTAALAAGAVAAHQQAVLQRALADLQPGVAKPEFVITPFIADELATIADADLPRYLFHRYRYDVFPRRNELDDWPPYLQLEPSSICNFRCVFCYQTDPSFSRLKTGFMGKMSLELFQQLVDDCAGHVEFGSLASRGEPTACPELGAMLAYASGKFLGLKLNTNAFLLDEARIHGILSSGIKTVVFSADAAAEPQYSQMRVGGNLARVHGNVQLFRDIRAKHYPHSPMLTRVSGVLVDPEHQKIEDMVSYWGEVVDQVAFVKYNPWESVYTSAPTEVTAPCSDLWRRMFVWYDGLVNPCDTDYKSHLQVGRFPAQSLSALWRSPAYEALRSRHQAQQRGEVEPCRRCVVT